MSAGLTLGLPRVRTVGGSVVFDPSHHGFDGWIDLNGDGYTDRIVTGAYYPFEGNQWVARPGWLAWGTPTGWQAATAAEFPAASMLQVHAREFALGDFNEDGHPDLYIADHGYDATPFPGYQNRLYLSDSTGNYRDATSTLPQKFDFTHSVATGDIDGDGRLDIFVGNGSLGACYVLRGDGRGGFVETTSLLPIGPGQALGQTTVNSELLVDLDGDRLPELVVGGDRAGSNRILWNTGGSYAQGAVTKLGEPVAFGQDWGVMDIASTDINFDGRPDLLVSYVANVFTGGWQLRLYINKGDRNFVDETETWLTRSDVITGGLGAPRAPWIEFFVPVDLNVDGRMDYFINSQYENGENPAASFPVFFLQQEDGRFAPVTTGDLLTLGVPATMFWKIGFVQRGLPGTWEFAIQYHRDGEIEVYTLPITFASAESQWHAGTAFADTLTGGSGADWFGAYGGNDIIDGGAGIDLVRYAGSKAQATLAKTATGWTVATPADGTDTLSAIERLKFADTHVALDVDGHAGQVAKLLGAVFGAASVTTRPQYVGIGLSYLDDGMSYTDLAALALQAAGARTEQQVVDRLFTNVVGVAPSAAQAQPFLDMLAGGMTIGTLATLAADHALNQTHIDLVGLAQTGIAYIPYG